MEIVYEITGGIVKTPEKGTIIIPPEKTGRKDLEVGEMVITRAMGNSRREEQLSIKARENGIKEIGPIMSTILTFERKERKKDVEGKERKRDDGRG